MIEINNINFKYKNGQKKLIKDFSLTIEKNKVNLIVGKNGAGKSTLIKIISGLISDYSGTIVSNAKSMSFVPQVNNFPKNYKVISYLIDFLMISNNIKKKEVNSLIESRKKDFDVQEVIRMNMGDLSSGQFKKVLFFLAILNKSEVIILDEPFTNLDEETIDLFLKLILKEKSKRTFIISSHLVDRIKKIIDKITILDNGEVILSKKFSNKIISKYLSKEDVHG